ncbi:hypothetical protein [Streptomyces sp. NPDC054838]
MTTATGLWVAGCSGTGEIKFLKRGSSDSDWSSIPGGPTGAIHGEVALAHHDQALFAMYRRAS